MTRVLGGLTLILVTIYTAGCGYTLRGNTRKFFEENQIRTLYVEPVKNNSYKAGVEITVYNALRKRISQGGYVRLVDSPQAADAQIAATVTEAVYTAAGPTSAKEIATAEPLLTGPGNVQIASSYNVNLKVLFQLKTVGKMLWTDELSRAKSFPASTYYGVLGSTSALINESEFERTLSDLSASIVTDAEESMNSVF